MAKRKLRANFTMPKRAKAAWLKALRSGKLKQTQSNLYNPEDKGFCCLGVLCLTQGVSRKEMEDVAFPENLASFETVFGISKYDFSQHVDERGHPSSPWQVPYNGELAALDRLNDCDELSFQKIANIIERTVDTH